MTARNLDITFDETGHCASTSADQLGGNLKAILSVICICECSLEYSVPGILFVKRERCRVNARISHDEFVHAVRFGLPEAFQSFPSHACVALS